MDSDQQELLQSLRPRLGFGHMNGQSTEHA